MRNDSAVNALTALLSRLAARAGLEACPDADLLAGFTESRDEQVFRAMVDRHGPLVWGVCSRALGNHQDAEDAFQATFVALSQAVAAGTRIGILPAWLHEVARRTSAKLRRASVRRREVTVESIPEPFNRDSTEDTDLAGALDDEVGRLPDRLRQPFILCHYQQKSYEEAAALLGYSVSTVCRRVTEACDALRDRISRLGLAPAGAAALMLSVGGIAAGAVPPGLADRAARIALASGEATGPVASAAAGALKAASYGKVKAAVLGLAVVASAAIAGMIVPKQLEPVGDPAVPVAGATSSPASPVPGGPVDRFGDPLPPGAVARIGNLRFRAKTAGHDEVAFLPGNRALASVHRGDTVRVWEITTGRVSYEFEGPARAMYLAVSPDGKQLAAAGQSEVRTWDLTVTPPRPLWTWAADETEGALTALAYAPDSGTLAVGDSRGDCVRLLAAGTGLPSGVLEGAPQDRLEFSHDGTRLAGLKFRGRGATGGLTLLVWDLATGEALPPITDRPVIGFALSPRDNALAWAASGGKVEVRDLASGRIVGRWQTEAVQPFLAYLPDGSAVLEFGSDRIIARDPATGHPTRPAVVAPDLGIVGMGVFTSGKRLSPDGKLFAASVTGGQIAVWDTNTGLEAGPDGQVHGPVRALAFSPDGRSLTTLSGIWAAVRTWDAVSGAPGVCPALSPNREAIAGDVGYGTNGRPFGITARAAAPLSIVSWDPVTGAAASRFETPADRRADRFTSLALAPEGGLVAWCVNGSVTVSADPATGRVQAQVNPRRSVPNGYIQMAFSGNGAVLATFARSDRVVEFWGTKTGELRATLKLPSDPRPLLPRHIAVSNDAARIAVTARTEIGHQAVEVWNVAAARVETRFLVDADVHKLAFSPNGTRLAAGVEDGSVRVWDPDAAKETTRYTGHRARVVALAFSSDGRRLASGSSDGTGLVWDATRPPPGPP